MNKLTSLAALALTAWMPLQQTQAQQLKAPATTAYCMVTAQDSWNEDTNRDEVVGVYSFTLGEDILSLEKIFTDVELTANGGATYGNGKFYYMNTEELGGSWTIVYLGTYNFDEGTYDVQADYGTYFAGSTCMAYDDTNGYPYGLFYDRDKTGMVLYRLDFDELEKYDEVAIENTVIVAAAFNSAGQLYGITNDGRLVRIDKESGEVETIGETGLTPADGIQSAYFWGDQLYWAAYVSLAGENYSLLTQVDIATGEATQVGELPDGAQIAGLYVPGQNVSNGVPDFVGELEVTFAEAETEGVVTFTVPTTTFEGDELTGEVEYVVTLNGETVATAATAPGRDEYVMVQAEPGENTIAVYVRSEAGDGPKSDRTVWVGYDVPKAIDNVLLTIDEATGEAQLTWDAPTEGIHGAYFTPSALTFEVKRLADDVVVAEDWAENAFSDVISDRTLAAHKYAVTPIEGDVRGETTVSNSVVFGDALNVPYIEDFSDEDNFQLFTSIDADGDGRGWVWTNGFIGTQYGAYHGDDWLLTPPLKLSKAAIYTLTFRYLIGMDFYPERLSLYYGQGTDTDDYEPIATNQMLTSAAWTDKDFTFTVPSDGDYRLAFRAHTAETSIYMKIDDIQVTGENLPSGISQATAADCQDAPLYDLQGRSVKNADRKGIYLSKGKKCVVK